MLEGNVIVLEHTQQAIHKAHFAVHQVLAYGDHGKVRLACYAGYLCALDNLGGEFGNNARTRMFRFVRIANIDRYTHLAHRRHGFVVQDAGSHVGQFANLCVGHLGHGPGVGHNTRIRHQQPGHIGPVFIQRGMRCTRGNRATDIGTTAGKRAHFAFCIASVKARHHVTAGAVLQACAEQCPGGGVDQAVAANDHAFRRLDKLGAQPCRQQQAREMLPARCRKVRAHACRELRPKVLQVLVHHRLHAQLLLNRRKTLGHLGKWRGEIGVHTRRMMAEIQQVRDLGICAVALAGSRGHNDAATGIRLDNRPHLAQLCRARQAGTAEFTYDTLLGRRTSRHCLILIRHCDNPVRSHTAIMGCRKAAQFTG